MDNLFVMTQSTLLDLEQWSHKSGFTFSATKPPPLKLNNENLKFETSISFLGMTLDQKLNWNAHIENLISSCYRRLNLLRTLANREWGSDRQTLLMMYRTLIRSKLDYGSTAYASATNSSLKRLDTIQNSALRIDLGKQKKTLANIELHQWKVYTVKPANLPWKTEEPI
ncbi:hypothetical protein JTB14_033349 [Gonioctena quinquepunctata]|nr:hypothetical protein JTB14_033349 [Gonioctena quinquepunctata]